MITQNSHQIGDLIAARYRVRSVLGQGSTGCTFAVEDVHTHQKYAVKALSLKGMQDWKQLELFEREAKVLSQLDHPNIPNYIDYFQTDSEVDRCFYIVQELVSGKSLADWVEHGRSFSQAKVRRLALKVLDILKYLHELTPPIIHRDIKPQNIILSNNGQIYLVDFGAVQNVYRNTMLGSTVVGTYGYMAPEQFQGKAVPATDLYSLGATLLFLLAYCSPVDIPRKRLKVDFRSVIQLDSKFADWLDLMLEPNLEDRFDSAQAALDTWAESNRRAQSLSAPVAIDNLFEPPQRTQPLLTQASIPRQQPMHSKVKLQLTATHLAVEIPPPGLNPDTISVGCLSLLLNGLSLGWAVGAIAMGGSFILPLLSIPLVTMGIVMLGTTIYRATGYTHLVMNPQSFELVWHVKLLGLRYRRIGRTKDIKTIKLTTAYTSNNRPIKCCTLLEYANSHKFGTMLSPREKSWLVAEIGDFLTSQQQ